MSQTIPQMIDEMFLGTPELAPVLNPRAPNDEFRYFLFPLGVIGMARGHVDELADVFKRMGVVEVNRPRTRPITDI